MARQPKNQQQPDQPDKQPRRKKSTYGAGSVYPLKDGRFAASIKDPVSGKRIVRYGKTHKEAERQLEDIKFEIRQHTLATGPNQTLKQFLERWMMDVYYHEVRESSFSQRQSILKVQVLPALGHIQLRKLTAQQVQAFYTKKLREGKSPATIANIHALLHKALKVAVRWKLVSYNVCDQVTVPSLEDQQEGIALTMEQAVTLLKACQGHYLEALITLALLTGMRHGEINALRWDDINFEEGYLRVQRTVGRIGKKGLVERPPKTRKSKREIALPGLVMEALARHRAKQQAMQQDAGEKWENRDLVFTNQQGGYLQSSTTLADFRQLLEKESLPRLRLHDLRHTASTLFSLEMEKPEKLVQDMLGHERIEMTRGKYTHSRREMLRKMMEDVDRVFREKM